MADRTDTKRSVLFGVLFCLAAVLLVSLPALGLRLVPQNPPDDQRFESRSARQDPAWVTPVRISGRVEKTLSPGVASPIVLTFRNGSSVPVRMQRVRIKVRTVIAPNATATLRCTRLDFEIKQMRKRTLRIPVGRSDLTRLGMPLSKWPTLAMRNRPVNQDGCKGAQLVLRFRAKQVGR